MHLRLPVSASLDRRTLYGVLFVGIGGFLSALFGIAVTVESERLASIWPANAFLLGTLLLLPRRLWLPIIATGALANFGANLVIGDSVALAAALTGFNIFESVFGAWILRRKYRENVGSITRKWLYDLVLWAGIIACALSTTLASLIVSFQGASFVFSWTTSFPAHLLGVVTLVPVIVSLVRNRHDLLEEGLGPKLVWISLLAGVVSLTIFVQGWLPVSFLIFPVLTYAAFRAGVPGASAAIFVFTAIATSMTVRGFGPIMMIDGSEHLRVLFLQFLIVTATFSSIPVGLAIADRRRAAERLVKARKEAEAATRAKASFLANMSHEIRTPMNGVLGFAELLQASPLDAEQHRQVGLIVSSAEALLALLNDILDISKVDAGRLEIVREGIDLDARVAECTALIEPLAEARGLTVTFESDPVLPGWVIGDALRLRQILLNLLGNAVKFTENGGITVRTMLREDAGAQWIDIAVIDTGIGIEPARQTEVFEEFAQAESDTAQRFGGTGLGLAISRRLAGLMGGMLSMDSEPGKGTIVTLSIPLTVADPVYCAPVMAPRAAPAPASRSDIYVLLAEDLDINREVIGAMLARLGCRVDYAEDGREAAAFVETADDAGTPYDIVFMDVQMPYLDGMAATGLIRALKTASAATPIVALTANGFPEDIEACLAAGMDAVLAKPVRIGDLDAAIADWATNRGSAETSAPATANAPGESLRDRYAARKAESLDRIGELMRSNALADTDLEEIAAIAHKLAGSAGMFGDGDFGMRAAEVEEGLGHWPESDRAAKLVDAVARLRAAA